MIRASLNYPNPHVCTHGDPQCGQFGVHQKPEQRHVRLDLPTLSSGLETLIGLQFGSRSEINDVWVEADLDDLEFERASVAFGVRPLAQRYSPFGGLAIETHCEGPKG